MFYLQDIEIKHTKYKIPVLIPIIYIEIRRAVSEPIREKN